MKRRDLLKLGASAAAAPAALAQHSQHSATTAPIVPQAAWTPQLFDAHQNETVVALIERVIPATDTPGAKAALVNRHLDGLLHEATREHGKPFVRCSKPEQIAMLEAMEAGSGPGRNFVHLVKSLTAGIYYATEIGYQEMNKGGRVPAMFACRDADRG